MSFTSPALGSGAAGLLSEAILTGYNDLGAPETLSAAGVGSLVKSTSFTGEGRVGQRILAGSGLTEVTRAYGWDLPTGQLRNMTATQNGVLLQREDHWYDAIGQLKAVMHDRPGNTDDSGECYTYDGQHRLSAAMSTPTLIAPSVTVPVCAPGDPALPGAYSQQLQIDQIGNHVSGPAGAYTYPASGAGSQRPHAPNSAGNTTMLWDAAGRMLSKTVTTPGGGGGGGTTTTTTTAPAATTTTAPAPTTTVVGTCTSQTFSWSGYQGLNAGASTFTTGVTIPAAPAGSTSKVTSLVVQSYDAQSAGTVPSRATQNQTGEQFGVRIGTVDVTALSADLPDTVAQGAVDDNYSGIKTSTLTGWVNTFVNTGGVVMFRHASLYGTSGDNSLSVYSANIVVETCTGGSSTTTTTTAGTTTTTAAATATTVAAGGTCSSQTFTWSGYQGVNASAPTFSTGVAIPAAPAGSTSKVTSVVVQAYDAQSSGTVPSRVTQNQTGEQIGVRIGATDVTALSADLPDTVAQGAVDTNYSGIKTSTLAGWSNTLINTGGVISVRHGSLYGTSGDNSLSVYNVTVIVETCTTTSGGATTTSTVPTSTTVPSGPLTVVSEYAWNVLNQLTQVKVNGAVTERMWYLPGGERVLHSDPAGVHLFIGGMAERHKLVGGTTKEQRVYTIGATMIAVRTNTSGVDETVYLLGDVRGSTSVTVKRNTAGVVEQQTWGTYGNRRTGTTTPTTSRGYIGQTSDSAGLNYLHHRYQDPATGIFLSVDPLIQKTGEPYLYAGGNPTTLKDPNGLEPCSWCSSIETRHHGKTFDELKKSYQEAQNGSSDLSGV